MIKALCTARDGRDILLIGLSHANLDRLRQDGTKGCIKIDGKLMGLSVDLLITAADTEAHIVDALSDLIGPETKLHIDPRLKG